jgi:hypothetical protein
VVAAAPQVPASLETRLERVETALAGRGSPEAIDRDLQWRFSVAERRGVFQEGAHGDRLVTLGREALQAGSGSDALRRRILLRAARAAALNSKLSEAQDFFAAAIKLQGPDDAIMAMARLREAQGEVDVAIRLLRDRRDPDSVSTLMDVLRRAKGDAWLIDREAAGEYTPAQLSATGIVVLAQTLARADLD